MTIVPAISAHAFAAMNQIDCAGAHARAVADVAAARRLTRVVRIGLRRAHELRAMWRTSGSAIGHVAHAARRMSQDFAAASSTGDGLLAGCAGRRFDDRGPAVSSPGSPTITLKKNRSSCASGNG